MFDAVQIGKYIYFLRKRKGITQGQLANLMSVSHQAVSNWERGGAMPDVSLLTRLASILETTVDRLFSATEGENEPTLHVVEEDCSQKEGEQSLYPKEYLERESMIKEKIEKKRRKIIDYKNNKDELIKDMENIKSSSIHEKIKNALESIEDEINELEDEISELQDDLEEERDSLRESAAFISKITSEEIELLKAEMDEVNESIEKMRLKREMTNSEKLRETYSVMIDELQERYDEIEIEIQDCKEEKADAILNEIGNKNDSASKCESKCESNSDSDEWDYIQSIAPFASQSVLDNMARDLIAKDSLNLDIGKITILAPFLSTKILDEFVEIMLIKKNFNECVTNIMPIICFLSEHVINNMISRILSEEDNIDSNILFSLAPFANSKALEKMIMTGDYRINKNLLVKVAPFINRAVIDKILSKKLL